METKELFNDENKNVLFTISWLLKNLDFDKSVGEFQSIDLFTFLENIQKFDYNDETIYDDFYFILEYSQESIIYIIRNINKTIVKRHEMLSLSQAKEYDRTTLTWLGRQSGRTIREKIKNNKIKAVKRVSFFDTPENRLFKKFIKILLSVYESREDFQKNEQISKVFREVRLWLKSEISKSIDEKKHISYNNVLLHHKHYHKILKSYKWFQNIETKIGNYRSNYPNQLYKILYFEILTQLQFFTDKPILPSNMRFDIETFNFDYSYDENILINDIDISRVSLSKSTLLDFTSLRETAKSIIQNEFQTQLDKDNRFLFPEIEDENAYIDMFKLIPEVLDHDHYLPLQCLLKIQKDQKYINGNNTKIIDLGFSIVTLQKTLQTYDSSVLDLFLKDIKKSLPYQKLYYIIPDYVNSFDFAKMKQRINSSFKNNSIPKSILVGLEYILKGLVKENDTIFIQQRQHTDIYITPLLIKYNPELENLTSGLYLERHPTKHIKEDKQFMKNLENEFGEMSSTFSNSILYNDFVELKKNHIKILDGQKVHLLSNVQIQEITIFLDEIKDVYEKEVLFQNNYFIVKDTQANLNIYKKVVELEKTGVSIWKEHLPELAMEIVNNGYYDKFVLVNDESEIINKKIKIEEHFVIPKGVEELSFPLILDNENINYRATLKSKEFPFDTDVECQLELVYDYEQENPYQLTFFPMNTSTNPISVEWVSSLSLHNLKSLPIPLYPPNKTWEDFRKDPKRDGNGYSDLLEWIVERLDLLHINKIPKYLIEKALKANKGKAVEGYFEWGGYDKNRNYYFRANIDGESVFCHSSNFIENITPNDLFEGKKVYLNLKKSRGKPTGINIRLSENYTEDLELTIIAKLEEDYKHKPLSSKLQSITKAIQSIRYPLIRVWNEHSLQDSDTPKWFSDAMSEYITIASNMIESKEVSVELKKELLLVLSTLHRDMPEKISIILVKFSKDLDKNKSYANNLALAIGDAKLEWQKEILNNILSNLDNVYVRNTIFDILAISFWRSSNLIYALSSEQVKLIEQQLIVTLDDNFNILKNQQTRAFLIKSIVRNLELLLALLRLREKEDFLIPQKKITLKYIKIIDEITKYFVENKIQIKTRISLELDKPEEFMLTHDLLYAIRVYLTGDTGSANKIKIVGISDD